MKAEGKIGIYFLKEIWDYYHGLKYSKKELQNVEWKYINGVFNTLGIGIEPTVKYLMNFSKNFDDFEAWIEQNGKFSQNAINYFNLIINRELNEDDKTVEKVFSEQDLEHWNKEGYVVLKDVISKEDCENTVDFICNKIGVNLNDKTTWYNSHPLKKGIMVQLFHSEILDKNRYSKKIRNAFEQLWDNKRLLVSMDRVSFNPPETNTYKFQGPNLHWDVSLKQPIPYGMQGLLYLTDTKKNQGAFTVIPGFHNLIDSWLKTLKVDPRSVNLLDFFNENPISANAGDFIIWNHSLPHGSRPNHSTLPRIVQYINYQPIDLEYQSEWI
ncbi:phytanoyl-CoA dioxygenase family protein [Maribacter sp. CXY002]|uniref:phytanoyl-CoA dioxygenase family protein n=1 Tax=Maribacter luteocoastalis TaxID=3407671 RepID=UPI003B66D61F